MLPHNPESTTLAEVEWVVVESRGGSRERRRLVGVRPHKRFRLLRFEGVRSVDAAEALVGARVYVRGDQLPPAGPGEVYHADLIGCMVRTVSGDELGTIREVLSTPGNDVCVVRDAAREVLVPLIADVIAELDIERRLVLVRPVPGLLDGGAGAGTRKKSKR